MHVQLPGPPSSQDAPPVSLGAALAPVAADPDISLSCLHSASGAGPRELVAGAQYGGKVMVMNSDGQL